jgi:hypothetical protein
MAKVNLVNDCRLILHCERILIELDWITLTHELNDTIWIIKRLAILDGVIRQFKMIVYHVPKPVQDFYAARILAGLN